MGEMLEDDQVLRHVVDLRHLITDGETSWDKFQLVGLSGRDGFLYLVACKMKWNLPEIGIFHGSPLLPNSWKLISRFSVSCFVKLDRLIAHAGFSNDFTQIGIAVRGTFPQHLLLVGYCFILFDLNSSQWNDRPFLWKYHPTVYLYYRMLHTCVGWILYPDFIAEDLKTVFRFSMDPEKECITNLFQFAQEIINSDGTLQVYVSNDNLYCFHSEHHHGFKIYIIYLNRDGFPWDRYTVDSDGDHLLLSFTDFTKKFMNNVPIFKALTCTRTSDNEPCSYADQTLVSQHCCLIYSVIIDSDMKCCRVEKNGQFMDHAALARLSINNFENDQFMVYEIADGMLTKSKRFAIFDGLRVDEDVPTLYLETIFFKPPTLKELCSLTLVKALCQKTNHVVQLHDDGAVTFSMDTWSGGPSVEVYEKLGLNIPTLNFGQMEP